MDPAPAALSLCWRSAGILVYAQSGEQPSAADEMVATFNDPAVAAAAVRAWNAGQAGL